MSTTIANRVRAGVPAGGQFATSARGEADVDLAEADGDLDSDAARESIVERDTVFTQRYDTKEEKLAAIHAELEDRVTSLADDREWNDYLDTMSKFHRYSFSNQMLIAIQTRGKATHVAGFRKWQEMERQVRKGEKGITILAPRRVTVTEKDANGNPVLDAKGKPKKTKRTVGFTTASVFDISQTDGKDLPTGGNRVLTEEPPAGFREDLENAISAEGFTVAESDDLPGGASGYTDPLERKVVIRAGMTPANQAKTLAHELGHIKSGHLDHMDEYHTGHGGKRNAFEVEAESVAYVLCRSNGMSPQVGDYSGKYIAGWGGTDGEQVRKSAEKVQSVVKDILGNGNWRNAQEES